MSKHIKEYVNSALRVMLEPIVLILVRNGITFKEFSLFCKHIYVDIVSKHYGIHGRPTNTSRISVITGIDRKEVKRIKDLLVDNSDVKSVQQSQDRLTRLLSAWHQDEGYIDNNGEPIVIPVEGSGASFAMLCKHYGGDIPNNALLKELIRAECIERIGDDHIKVLKRYFFPANSDPESLLRAGTVINELADTLYHNLYISEDSPKLKKRFERRASNNVIDAKYQEAFNAFLQSEGQEFLERVDAWLSEHEAKDSQGKVVRLGVGVFGLEQKRNTKDDSERGEHD